MVYKKVNRYIVNSECLAHKEKWDALSEKDCKRVLKFIDVKNKYRRRVLNKLVGTSDKRVLAMIHKYSKSEIEENYLKINKSVQEIEAFFSEYDTNNNKYDKQIWFQRWFQRYESITQEFEESVEQDFKCLYTVRVWKLVCVDCGSFVNKIATNCKCATYNNTD